MRNSIKFIFFFFFVIVDGVMQKKEFNFFGKYEEGVMKNVEMISRCERDEMFYYLLERKRGRRRLDYMREIKNLMHKITWQNHEF
jgi:hypothetical protein